MILFIARLRSYLCQQAFLIASAYLLLLTAGDVLAGQKVSLQLRWDHQFQFAGYYAHLSVLTAWPKPRSP